MPTTWHLCSNLDEPVTLAAHLMRRFHQDLADADVRVLILFAANPDTPPLKKGGYPAAALVRVLALKWRVVTGYDALVELDQAVWDAAERDRRAAIIDHELSHLELVVAENEEGKVVPVRDDANRPKLKLRDGDWFVGDGFVEVIERHGEAALEVVIIQSAYRQATEALNQAFAEAGN